MYGPTVTTNRRCDTCPACKSESYRVQSDSGCNVYCTHPAFESEPNQRKYIGDTTWTTPYWCPVAS